MMRRSRTWLSVLGSTAACATLVACSHSSSNGTSSSSSSAAAPTTINAGQVTALQVIVQYAQPDASVPQDTQTAQVAAQIAELDLDRASSIFAANALQVAEQDPSRAATAAQLEIYRQKQLAQAASDVSKIQALQASTTAPGKALLTTDGGAGQVLSSVVATAFAAQAAAYLAAGKKAAASGTPGPSADDITGFLQGEAIATADEGPGGHDVAGRVLAAALLADASVSSIIALDGGTP